MINQALAVDNRKGKLFKRIGRKTTDLLQEVAGLPKYLTHLGKGNTIPKKPVLSEWAFFYYSKIKVACFTGFNTCTTKKGIIIGKRFVSNP